MPQTLKDKIHSIPSSPGVYFFKDKKDQIIYIGKAKSLKKRVSSYFLKKQSDIKTSVMIKHIDDIDFLVVNNEAEALINRLSESGDLEPIADLLKAADTKQLSFGQLASTSPPKEAPGHHGIARLG